MFIFYCPPLPRGLGRSGEVAHGSLLTQMEWDWILVGFSSGWTAVTPVDGWWWSACVLPLEVRQGAWTALIRRGRLVRSQLQRRRKAQAGGPLPPSVGSSRRVDPVLAVLGHTIVWSPPCLEMALCRVRGSNPWREETVLVARRSWRGALDCKSSASAEWVRIPPPPRRLDCPLFMAGGLAVHGYVAEWSMAHAWKACGPEGPVGSNPIVSAGWVVGVWRSTPP